MINHQGNAYQPPHHNQDGDYQKDKDGGKMKFFEEEGILLVGIYIGLALKENRMKVPQK